MLPSKDELTICFAHVAYRLRERFLTVATGIESFEVRDSAALEQRIGEADVLVISGLWRNDLLSRTKRLRFIQSIGAGTDQFSREALKQHGVRLASPSPQSRIAVQHARSELAPDLKGKYVNSVGDGIEEVTMATMVSIRRSTFGINCVRCKDEVIAPKGRSTVTACTSVICGIARTAKPP